MKANIEKKYFKGSYYPPGDKSISHRIIILGSQTVGKSVVSNLLEGEDVINTIKVMRELGANIRKIDNKFIIYGVPPGSLLQPNKKLNFGNSGTGSLKFGYVSGPRYLNPRYIIAKKNPVIPGQLKHNILR